MSERRTVDLDAPVVLLLVGLLFALAFPIAFAGKQVSDAIDRNTAMCAP